MALSSPARGPRPLGGARFAGLALCLTMDVQRSPTAGASSPRAPASGSARRRPGLSRARRSELVFVVAMCSYATDIAGACSPVPLTPPTRVATRAPSSSPRSCSSVQSSMLAAALGVPADPAPRSARRARLDAAPDAAEMIGRCGDPGGWGRATAMRRGRPTVVAYAARRRQIRGGRARCCCASGRMPTRGRVARDTALLAAEVRWVSGRNAVGAKSYPSARITRVSGWTPSCFIASAAGSVCMNS